MIKIEVKGLIVPSDDKWAYDFLGIQAVSPGEVLTALEQAAGQPVTVEINSPGGSLDSGVEIYTALRSYPGEVCSRVVAFAASAASVIAMAGKSEISPAARLMIHNASTAQQGDHRDMDHTAEMLRKADRSIAAAYMDKTGLSESDILDLMAHETTFTAQEAVEKGFIDRLMFQDAGQKNELAASAAGLLPPEAIRRIRAMADSKKEADLKKARAEFELLTLKG